MGVSEALSRRVVGVRPSEKPEGQRFDRRRRTARGAGGGPLRGARAAVTAAKGGGGGGRGAEEGEYEPGVQVRDRPAEQQARMRGQGHMAKS